MEIQRSGGDYAQQFRLGKDGERLETHREGQDPRSESQLQSHSERGIQRGGDNGYRQATETDVRRLRSDVGARQQATDSEVDHRAQDCGDGIGNVEKPGGIRPAKRSQYKINVRRVGEAQCITKDDDGAQNRPVSRRVRVEVSIMTMDQGQEPKFPLLVYAHPEYLIKPWPREALIVVWFPSLYEEQSYGKKHINNISNKIGLYAIFCSQRAYGEQLGFNDIWETAFVELGGIARQDLEPDRFSYESASTQRLAYCAATPRTLTDTVRSKMEIARLRDKFVLDTTFNSSRYKILELKRRRKNCKFT